MFGLEPGWVWAIGGVILLIAEVVAPGFFLFFLGVAATATGALTLLLDLDQVPQVVLFLIFAALAVMYGRRYYAQSDTSANRLLNDRGASLVGRTVIVVDPVDHNGGRVKVGDSEWSARGGPAAAGDTVRVVSFEGNCLEVEPVVERDV